MVMILSKKIKHTSISEKNVVTLALFYFTAGVVKLMYHFLGGKYALSGTRVTPPPNSATTQKRCLLYSFTEIRSGVRPVRDVAAQCAATLA